MAYCPDCNKRIRRDLDECPACGTPLCSKEERERRKQKGKSIGHIAGELADLAGIGSGVGGVVGGLLGGAAGKNSCSIPSDQPLDNDSECCECGRLIPRAASVCRFCGAEQGRR